MQSDVVRFRLVGLPHLEAVLLVELGFPDEPCALAHEEEGDHEECEHGQAPSESGPVRLMALVVEAGG